MAGAAATIELGRASAGSAAPPSGAPRQPAAPGMGGVPGAPVVVEAAGEREPEGERRAGTLPFSTSLRHDATSTAGCKLTIKIQHHLKLFL